MRQHALIGRRLYGCSGAIGLFRSWETVPCRTAAHRHASAGSGQLRGPIQRKQRRCRNRVPASSGSGRSTTRTRSSPTRCPRLRALVHTETNGAFKTPLQKAARVGGSFYSRDVLTEESQLEIGVLSINIVQSRIRGNYSKNKYLSLMLRLFILLAFDIVLVMFRS